MEIYFILAIVVIIQIVGFTFLWQQRPKELTSHVLPTVTEYPQEEEIFVSFSCSNCQNIVILRKRLYPGEVALLDCDVCNLSWTIFNPQLIISPTKQLPEPIKVGVAENSPMNG